MTKFVEMYITQVAAVAAGDTAPQAAEAYSECGPLFIRTKDVGRSRRDMELQESFDKLSTEWLQRNKMKLFTKGSVLIPKSGESVRLNHRAMLAVDAYVANHLAVLTPDTNLISPDYLFWWAVFYDPSSSIYTTSLPYLNLSALKKEKISIPSLQDQKVITDGMNRIESTLEMRKWAGAMFKEICRSMYTQEISKTFAKNETNAHRSRNRSNMQKPTRKLSTEFLKYSSVPLSDVCQINIGRTPRRNENRYWNGNVPWASIGDLKGKYLSNTREGITNDAVDEVMPEPAKKGSLLFSFKLTIGKVSIANRDVYHNEAIASIQTMDENVLNMEYLYYTMLYSTLEDKYNHAVLGKTMNVRLLNQVEIPLLPIENQKIIAESLSGVDNISSICEKQEALIEELIKSYWNTYVKA